MPINNVARIVPLTSKSYWGTAVLIPTLPPLIIFKFIFVLSYIDNISFVPFCLIDNAGPVPEFIKSIFSVAYVEVFNVVVVPVTYKFDAVKVPFT